ncbi:hypothetical protein D3C87_718660 [compost metagenome]
MASIQSVSSAYRPQAPSALKSATSATQVKSVAAQGVSANGNLGDNLNSLSSIGRLGNAAHTAIKGGAEGLSSGQGLLSSLKGFDLSGAFSAAKSLGQTALSWGTKSAGIQGAMSLVVNGYRAATKKISVAEAGSRVVGDTASGFVGGVAGTAAAAIGTAALGMIGLSGGLLTLGGAAVGMAGFFLGEKFFKETDLYKKLKSKVKSVLDYGFKPLGA